MITQYITVRSRRKKHKLFTQNVQGSSDSAIGARILQTETRTIVQAETKTNVSKDCL